MVKTLHFYHRRGHGWETKILGWETKLAHAVQCDQKKINALFVLIVNSLKKGPGLIRNEVQKLIPCGHL